MHWIGRLRAHPTTVELPQDLCARLSAWHDGQPASTTHQARYVLVDIVSDGLDPVRHTVQSLAALGLRQGVVGSHDVVLIESLPEIARQGECQLQKRLLDVLEQVGHDPLVTWKRGYVGEFLRVLYRTQLGFDWQPTWLDLAVLLPEFFPDSHVAGQNSFDAWLAVFGIALPGRLAALPDTIGMAKLLQIVLAEAGKRGIHTAQQLHDIEHSRRWLGK